MARLLVSFFLTVVVFELSLTKELTFELPDNEKMCFYENIEQGEQATLEFQVTIVQCFIIICTVPIVIVL